MSRNRRRFDDEFREGAVRLVVETGRPIAQVARDLGISETTLGKWVAKARGQMSKDTRLGESEREELRRLRDEVVELRMQRDVLKRSTALWVNEAMGRSR